MSDKTVQLKLETYSAVMETIGSLPWKQVNQLMVAVLNEVNPQIMAQQQPALPTPPEPPSPAGYTDKPAGPKDDITRA